MAETLVSSRLATATQSLVQLRSLDRGGSVVGGAAGGG